MSRAERVAEMHTVLLVVSYNKCARKWAIDVFLCPSFGSDECIIASVCRLVFRAGLRRYLGQQEHKYIIFYMLYRHE